MTTTTIMDMGTATSAPDLLAVVARYREDLGWLAELALPCVVYNKGPELDPALLPPGTRVETLPNVGREGHTFLTHILAAYGSLPRHTVFLQGNPFAHLAPADGEPVTPEGLRQRILDLAGRDMPFAGLAWFRLACDGLGRPHDLADPTKRGRWKGWGRDIPVGQTFEALFGAPAPNKFIARAPTGNMLVRADRILARPAEFYRRALALVLSDPEDERNTGHALERLWQAVFSGGRGGGDGAPNKVLDKPPQTA